MKKLLITTLTLLATQLSPLAHAIQSGPLQSKEQIESVLQEMTIREKIAIIHAWSKFSSPGVPRLGIPGLWCTDGPHGIRAEVKWDEWDQAGWTSDSCTAFPALTCLAATWNPEMARQYGQAIGEEALYRRKDVLLGPGVNIYRTPLGGRNFEYMGEDPHLSATMVVPYIHGVQENGVAACVKHFALNNQEDNRHRVNVHVDERALHELYLPAFRAAVQEGGAWSIMGSYNRYLGQYACHNHTLLVDILRGEWGFDGAVISDWGGCLNTDEAIHNGLDLEYGSWTNGLTEGASNTYDMYYLANPYMARIREGKVGTKELDEKVRNVLRLIGRTSASRERGFGRFTCEDHSATARRVADEGIVLLKNNGILPIRPAELATNKTKHGPLMTLELQYPTILVVGENAVKMMTVGGGSSSLKAKYEISPLEGIRRRFAQEADVRWVRGYVGDTGGEYNGVTTGQDLRDNRSFEAILSEAVQAAQEADIVIFVGGLNKAEHQDSESADRLQYNLPYRQDEVIEALAKANKNLVVVTLSGNAFSMPWQAAPAAILQGWYCGSETGNALADILSGDVNPSGRMPYTTLAELTDYPAHQFGAETYPGVQDEEIYTESFYVGYRYSDLKKTISLPDGKKLSPLKKGHLTYPFGFGLSYTTFAYANARVQNNKVLVDITNTGKTSGKEVVQLYAAPIKPSVQKPVKQLCGFAKIELAPGETRTVELTISDQAFCHYDPTSHQWINDAGKYELLVARNARDIEAKINYIRP